MVNHLTTTRNVKYIFSMYVHVHVGVEDIQYLSTCIYFKSSTIIILLLIKFVIFELINLLCQK